MPSSVCLSSIINLQILWTCNTLPSILNRKCCNSSRIRNDYRKLHLSANDRRIIVSVVRPKTQTLLFRPGNEGLGDAGFHIPRHGCGGRGQLSGGRSCLTCPGHCRFSRKRSPRSCLAALVGDGHEHGVVVHARTEGTLGRVVVPLLKK